MFLPIGVIGFNENINGERMPRILLHPFDIPFSPAAIPTTQ
jgi:hypothetical protein